MPPHSSQVHTKTLTAPHAQLEFIDLPGTRLHYAVSGDGPPLIIVPATVSLIRQWLPLVQFLGLRFRAHFFELPGHGASSPYPTRFNSRLVPGTVAALADRLGYASFALMGFSFGGLLAMRTLEDIRSRIESVILLSPLVSHRALLYSARKQWMLKQVAGLLTHPHAQHAAVRLMHTRALQRPLIYTLSRFSKVDPRILESKDALNIPATTLDVLSYTLNEILELEFHPSQPYSTPCYFGMSVNDDLIAYPLTEQIVQTSFSNLKLHKFYHPYHQPPRAPTFDWLVSEFYPLLELLA